MIKTSLLTFVVATGVSSPNPTIITEPIPTMLECNNTAIVMSADHDDIGCLAYDPTGVVFEFPKSGQPVRYIYGYKKAPDVVIEIRKR